MKERTEPEQGKDCSWQDFDDFWQWYELAMQDPGPEPGHVAAAQAEEE